MATAIKNEDNGNYVRAQQAKAAQPTHADPALALAQAAQGAQQKSAIDANRKASDPYVSTPAPDPAPTHADPALAQAQAAQRTAYDANGNSYSIGSGKGLDFLNNAAAGNTITGSDGSTWTKNQDGTVSIKDKAGNVFSVQGTAPSTIDANRKASDPYTSTTQPPTHADQALALAQAELAEQSRAGIDANRRASDPYVSAPIPTHADQALALAQAEMIEKSRAGIDANRRASDPYVSTPAPTHADQALALAQAAMAGKPQAGIDANRKASDPYTADNNKPIYKLPYNADIPPSAIPGIGTSASGTWAEADGAKYTAYDADGNPYYIGSDTGVGFVNGAANGSTIIGGDGSTWTKDANGNIVIVDKNGRTYTVQGESVNTPETVPGGTQTGIFTSQPDAATVSRLNKDDYFNNGRSYLDEQKAAAEEQIRLQNQYAVEQGIQELLRAQEDAQAQFQTQRDQVSRDEQIGLDNQALYAEARGDKGGIGEAQYAAIQAQAAQNRLAVSQQQTQLATDTARQIADLRARGEFETADELLSLTQTYLGQLQQLYENAEAYALDVDKFNIQLEQWEAEYAMSVAQLTGEFNGKPTYAARTADMERAAAAGDALLTVGIMPSDEQLAALGLTREQASAYILAKTAASAGNGYSGSEKTGSTTDDDKKVRSYTLPYANLTDAERSEQYGNYQTAAASAAEIYSRDGLKATIEYLRELYLSGALSVDDYGRLHNKYGG